MVRDDRERDDVERHMEMTYRQSANGKASSGFEERQADSDV